MHPRVMHARRLHTRGLADAGPLSIRLFCASLGLSEETPRWPDVKVDFFMWLVARVFTLHATDEQDGAQPKKVAGAGGLDATAEVGNPADILHLRENLGKTAGLHMPTHYDVEKAAVKRLAERAIRSDEARVRLLERLETEVETTEVLRIGGASARCWEASGVVGVFMDEWQRCDDEMRDSLERRIDGVFYEFDANGNGLLSYGEFEELLRQISPQHAENALDLYDEALQYADDDDGMEVESVNSEAWKAVVLKYDILSIDPKQVALPPRKPSPQTGAAPPRPSRRTASEA